MEKIKIPGYAKSLSIGICIGILLKIFILDILTVSGTSMEPTLQDGQKILVNRLAYGLAKPFGSNLMFSWNKPKENEIVVFLYNLLKESKSVPEETVLVIGDNHLNSIDSRTYGFVPRMNILGRIRGR